MASIASMEQNCIQNTTKKKQNNNKNSVLGSVIGAGAGAGCYYEIKKNGCGFFTKKFINFNKDLPQETVDTLIEATNKAFIESGVKENGYELFRIDDGNANFVTKKMADSLKKCIEKFKIPVNKEFEKALTMSLADQINIVKNGQNAFCNLWGKQIYLPKNKLSTCGFHEIGHALNSLKGSTKILQKIRGPLMLMPFALMLFGVLGKKSKPKEGEELSKGAKAKNFVRKNAGIFSFLAMTPMVTEEGIASIKGGKLAKELLSPELAKKVSHNNKLAWCTYLCAAMAAGVGTWVAVKIKDIIQNKKDKMAEQKV